MAKYIECRNCDSPNCDGCNIHTLATMLHKGKLDSLMDMHHSINPTADVAPVVHGRWVRIQGMAPPEYHGKHRCSVCYARALERKFHEELSDHCPNCGAKIDLGG